MLLKLLVEEIGEFLISRRKQRQLYERDIDIDDSFKPGGTYSAGSEG